MSDATTPIAEHLDHWVLTHGLCPDPSSRRASLPAACDVWQWGGRPASVESVLRSHVPSPPGRKLDGGAPWWRRKVFANWAGWR